MLQAGVFSLQARALPSCLAAMTSRWANAWCSSASRPFAAAAAAAAGPAPPAAGEGARSDQPSEEEQAASLPPEQLAKALLAGNVRGQLTTIKAGQPGAEEPKVSSSVLRYVSPRGEAPVLLLGAEHAQHLHDLGESAKASLATGHIGPAWFVQRLRATGWLPRRVALLGSLQPLPPAEVRFAVDQARKAFADAAPALAAQLPAEAELGSLAGYRLGDISQAVYVDAAGKQHAVAPQDLDSCFLDPLALPQHDLLAAINNEPAWQAQLQLFCAAYLGVHAPEVLLAQADRLGFSLLGRPPAGAPEQQAAGQQAAQQAQQRWRQFRIGSSRELRSQAAFMELLEQMREEVKAATGAQ